MMLKRFDLHFSVLGLLEMYDYNRPDQKIEEYKQWNKTEFESIKSIDPDVVNKLKPMIRKGVPNEFKRDVIIKLFNVIGSEAKFTYENSLKAVYGVS